MGSHIKLTKYKSHGITVSYDRDKIRKEYNNAGKRFTKKLEEEVRRALIEAKAKSYFDRGGSNKGWVTRYYNAFSSAGGDWRELRDYKDGWRDVNLGATIIDRDLVPSVMYLREYIVEAFRRLMPNPPPSVVYDIERWKFDVSLMIYIGGFGTHGSINGDLFAEREYEGSGYAYRLSLKTKKPEYQGDGVSNIIRQFNNGWHARGYAYGVWEKTKLDSRSSDGKVIRSRKDFEGLHFIQEGIRDYNARKKDYMPVAKLAEDSIYNH